MNAKTAYATDIACENAWNTRTGMMESHFTESSMNITKTTFDLREPNGLLPRDAYYGIHCGPIWEFDEQKAVNTALLCANKLIQLMKSVPAKKRDYSVLTVGLGNRNAIPDALGPLCADKIEAGNGDGVTLPRVFTISPGVVGQTGIITSNFVRAIAKETGADIVIAVDSLSARSSERLGSFIQIGNCGIDPGAGVGKRGKGISFREIGIPVISIGIPTVIPAQLLAEGSNAERSEKECGCSDLSYLSVTPMNCNAVIEIGASVISKAIELCLSAPMIS